MTKTFLLTEKAPDFFIRDLNKLGFEVDIKPGILESDLFSIAKNYIGFVVRGKVKISSQIITEAANLKYLLRPGSGLDIIDIEAAKKRGIYLLNSPEGNKDSVAEHAIGMLLSKLNHIPRSFNDIQNFKWTRKENTGNELKGSTVAIIGFGNMGSAFAERLIGFGVKIICYDKYKKGYATQNIIECCLNEIYKNADVVSFHIPLNQENKYLIDAEYLSNFKKPIHLINTSRGQILKTKDLISLINEGKIISACLDVLENENFDQYSKEEIQTLDQLIKTNKVIITPHIAGWTKESDHKIYSVLIDKLKLIIDRL